MAYEVLKESGVVVDRENNRYTLNFNSKEKRATVASAIPGSRPWEHTGRNFLDVPLHEDSVRILYNLGYKTHKMEPLIFKYDCPLIEGLYTPMEHQIATAGFLATHKRGYCFNKMRTGKTASATYAYDYIDRVMNVYGSALIVCPVSVMVGAWRNTIKQTLPHKKVVVLDGTKTQRIKKLLVGADYFIINFDGLKIIRDEIIRMVDSKRITKVLFDELNNYGNHRSGKWVAANKIANGKTPLEYVWGFTGTPGANVLHVYAMGMLVNPAKMRWTRYSSWREAVQYHYGSQVWQWRDRPEAPKIISEVLQPAVAYKKEDVMDLPPVVFAYREASLTDSQKRYYKSMKEDLIAQFDSGEIITAPQQQTMIQKLHQISLGTVIKKDEEEPVLVDNKDRMNVLYETIEASETKVVIFCAYVPAILRQVKDLRARYGEDAVAYVTGSVTGKKRDKIWDDFQNNPVLRILVCHPMTTAYGVELAAADTIIYNGPMLSGTTIFEQSLERLSSMKQKSAQIQIVFLYSTQEEYQSFHGLQHKKSMSEIVNDNLRLITGKAA